jgi:PAS domain S-box-containing protein
MTRKVQLSSLYSSQTISQVTGILVAIIGTLVLVGLIFDVEILKISAASGIVSFTALIWWSARALNWKDARQREAEEAGRASEERFRAVVQTAKDAIVSADCQGQIIFFNAGAEQIFGFAAGEVIGKPLTLLMPERYHDAHARGMRRFFSSEEKETAGKTVELAGQRKDGSEFPVELSLAEWRTGEGVFLTAIIRDITRRKKAEEEVIMLNEHLKHRTAQLEAVNKELQTFAYSVSHDLRAPLRAIKGFTMVLAEDHGDNLDAEGKDVLKRVDGATQRMTQLIDDLLSLSKVTRSEIHRAKVDMSALAETILAALQKEQPVRQVNVSIRPSLVVNADANLLRIALENLLRNAWKFTKKRSQAIIELGETQCQGESAYFVRDNGAGFDMAFADKLFAPFQRLHRASEFEGTGIGLATVQRIIGRHGGRLWAEAQPEKGATFYFSFPQNGISYE